MSVKDHFLARVFRFLMRMSARNRGKRNAVWNHTTLRRINRVWPNQIMYYHGESHPMEVDFQAVQGWIAATCFLWEKCWEGLETFRFYLLNGGADEPPQAGRETERPWSPGKHHASLSCREMFQQTLMVFLVNSRHNECSVLPTEFLLSTPTVVILKSVESPSLLYVCTLSSLSPPFLALPLRRSLGQFVLFFFHFIVPCLFLSLFPPIPLFLSLMWLQFSVFNLLHWRQKPKYIKRQ